MTSNTRDRLYTRLGIDPSHYRLSCARCCQERSSCCRRYSLRWTNRPPRGLAARPACGSSTSILFLAPRDRLLLSHVTIDRLEASRSVKHNYYALYLDLADAVNVAPAPSTAPIPPAHSGSSRFPRGQPAAPRTRRSNSCPTRCSAHRACPQGHAFPIALKQDVEPTNARQRDSPVAACGKATAPTHAAHTPESRVRGRYGF
jgi:hypothetical protein